ncbi:DUF4292 domain-containing protein [Paraflavisolibacter sp. H34]|uniref:DUF4292 domain-containing protein n=1 Tax=Huijunlia imazamoxiresistens TaxID=3127457 RepID=UPI003018FD2F
MMRIFAFVLAVCLMASCRSTKKIQTAIAKKDSAEVVPVHDYRADSLRFIRTTLGKLDSNQVVYKTFTAKMDVDYSGSGDKKYRVNANLRMYKDSAIWLSVNAILGIEAMRVLVTRDSVFLIDKLNKTYTSRSVDYLKEITALPLNLPTLQNLLIGNVVFLDSNIVSYSKNSNNTLSLLSIGSYFKNLITLSADNDLLLHSKLDDKDNARSRTADLSYSDYETKRGPLFSTKRKITVAEKNKLDIEMEFKQYDFNQEVSFPFSIPKNFRKK